MSVTSARGNPARAALRRRAAARLASFSFLAWSCAASAQPPGGDARAGPDPQLRAILLEAVKYYLDMEGGDRVRGLARYNGSPGRLEYPSKVLQRLGSKWYRH